jgi:hypothetical protein
MTGDGMEDFFNAVEEARQEYETCVWFPTFYRFRFRAYPKLSSPLLSLLINQRLSSRA